MKRRIFVGFLIVLGLLNLPLHGQGDRGTDQRDSDTTNPQTKRSVMLTIDFGDGAQKRYPAIPWKESMTVFDTLLWAGQHPHGIKFQHKGRGETVLVHQVDDLKNSGGAKNWVFRVNGKLADRSAGIFPLKPSDTILWRFERYK